MSARIVPARLGHVLRVAQRLDPALVAAAAARHLDIRVIMRDRFAESREAWALVVDGAAIAVGGWRGALLTGEAEAWLAVANAVDIRPYRFALARAVARHARRLLDCGMAIVAWTVEGDGIGCRFAEWCGLDGGDVSNGMRRFEISPVITWTR